MTPIAVFFEEKNIIGIAGSSIFNDTLINQFDNKRLFMNIIKYIQTFYKKREKDVMEKYKNLNVNKAVKLIEHEILINSKILNAIDKTIDSLWDRMIDLTTKKDAAFIKQHLEKSYKLIVQKIDTISSQIVEKINEFSIFGDEFEEKSRDLVNNWYVLEAEKREKLDMIRNNILGRLGA